MTSSNQQQQQQANSPPFSTDHTCHQLQNTSRSINMHGGIEKMDPNISIPDTWAENSNHNIQDSQCELCNAVAAFWLNACKSRIF